MFQNIKPISPVQQDFIWLAEYISGDNYSEFDINTKKENNFYLIDKEQLIRFGLIGHNLKFYFEVFGGTFKINNQMVEFIYKVDDKEYSLTGQKQMYKDIITYKDAESIISTNQLGNSKSHITQYNFGYKQSLEIDNIQFSFKPLFKIPANQPMYFNIRLVSNTDLNGRFLIKLNGFVVQEFEAPLSKNASGELNWILQ